MRRDAFIKELRESKRYMKRQGTNHDLFFNPKTSRKAPVPHHPEIKNTLCALIRKALGLG
jgi:mRNA interferase HicA